MGSHKKVGATRTQMGIILKLLGAIDLAGAAALFLAASQIVPARWVITVAACLVMKGIIFRGGPVSILDVIIGLYVAITPFTGWGLLNTLFAIYLLVKGIYSFV